MRTGEDKCLFGGLSYIWSSQTVRAYKQLSLSAGCLLTVCSICHHAHPSKNATD